VLSDEFQGLLPVDRMRVLDSLIGEASRLAGRNPAPGASASSHDPGRS